VVRSAANKVLRLVREADATTPAALPPPPPAPPPSQPRPSLDDAEILAALHRGDPRAAASLYRRTRPHVERTVLRLLGRDDAEHDDLVQLSLIAVVDSIHRFRGESSLDTWVSRVTANTVFKGIRKRRSERRAIDRESNEDDLPPPSSSATIDGIESRDLLRRVRAVLATIDPVKAYTVLLHDVAGYDLREVAEITEASVAAAQSRLVRGRTELQEKLEKDPELRDRLCQKGAGG